MSTPSVIALATSTGYTAIGCNWNGYPQDNGVLLLAHYRDHHKVEELMTLGEISSLREEVRGGRRPYEPPAEPLRLDLTPPKPTPPGESASWLITRLSDLETESRSTWKDLLNRVATAAVGPRTTSAPHAKSLARTRPGPVLDDRS